MKKDQILSVIVVSFFFLGAATGIGFLVGGGQIDDLNERIRAVEETVAELDIPDDKMEYGEYMDSIERFGPNNIVWGSKRDRISQEVIIQAILDHAGLEIERVPLREERFRLKPKDPEDLSDYVLDFRD